ncbi:molybdenum cofactor guanylyltransferase [Sphingomonas canadensis]|uniref:Molybdenum cofactor guanylyltransferase n=1 Tax=Sphingomonas canadensis TaxID=1219257 RepID=A0ABW3HAU7_9SPHN|nr:molybdenum cofactor guanylyltransferase [Sphingomonas canadensis]MCW3838277.1 molybdenum cofactor guanylyltransferase [Sphingomonas canadensis]
MRILGAVLAGGRSSRFGSDKALADLNGRPLIAHAIAALARQADGVIVAGREWDDWVPDRPGPDMGPLGGINAAIHAAAARGYAGVLTYPCDAPWLETDLRAKLASQAEGAYAAEMPVIGYWPSALAPVLDDWLATTATGHSVRAWAAHAGVKPVELGGMLHNVNTPDNLRALREILRGR